MEDSVQVIPVLNLLVAFIPVLLVIGIMWRWKLNYGNGLYALARMVVQLLLIGFFLSYAFETQSGWVVLLVLSVMLLSASWIALRTMDVARKKLYLMAFAAIASGGITVLLFITQGVLALKPWYLPNYMIPLAGMIFANSMNSVSLAGERLQAEIRQGLAYEEARKVALKAALIPITNSLFAVGLVSIPGLMTGQILSGVSPFIAARYQMVVMCMVFGSAGISATVFLILLKSQVKQIQE